jgi:hypothetical protein
MLKNGATALVLVAAVMVGCRAQSKKDAAAAPATMEQVSQIRAEFQQADPTVRVGLVSAVKADDHLAAVSDIVPTDFREGSPITFIDSQRNPIAHGKVVRVLENLIVVHYDQPAQGGREPREGDLAVKVLPG